MTNQNQNWLEIFLPFIVGFLGIGLLLIGIFLFDMKVKCPNFGKAVELQSKYVLFGGGCFVKTEKNQWVKDENYWNSPIK